MLKVVEKYTRYKYKFNIYSIVLQKTYILEFVCVFKYYFLQDVHNRHHLLYLGWIVQWFAALRCNW